MKLLTILSCALTLTSALPFSSSTSRDIVIPDDRLVEGRPVELRPVDGRPVIGRPVEPRPISTRSATVEEKRQNVVPNAYIVEFKQEYEHAQFYEFLKSRNVVYTIRVVYESREIMWGVSIQLGDGGDYLKMKDWIGISTIWPVRIISIPPGEPPYSKSGKL